MKTNKPIIEIQSRASLCNLSIGLPGNNRRDSETTKKVKEEHSLGNDAGHWDRQLYPASALKAIQKLSGAIRNWHYNGTLPYPEDGWQILPARRHLAYCEYLGQQKKLFDGLVEQFKAHFPEYVDWAKVQHNGTFDPTLYDPDNTLAKFSFRLGFRPIPASSQYEAGIKAILGVNAEALDDYVQEAAQEAQAELWGRVKGILQEVTGLDGRERKVKEPYIKDLFERLSELKTLVPQLNIAEDLNLDSLSDEISNTFKTMDPMEVREDESQRSEAVTKAKELLKKLSGYNF